MTWTYGGDPSLNDLSAVRFLVGDTDDADQLLQDEEIEYLLAAESDVHSAAADAADALAGKFSRKADKTVGPLKISLSQKSKQYLELAKRLRGVDGGGGGATETLIGAPYAGGLSRAERETDREDDDLVQPHFATGMLTNPEASGSDARGYDQ